ncbi:type VI secretion system baseplate subunit TssF [Reyranella sp. CPCC 100927]|uniref:type VI secretion system baseplate subunit TssF n=1 Tax=Reyranella sp. CPCC 100927 TaxID=2599616 RepID=UPI0011B71A1C|nr:type VI secretion system baseplate subunit TssF [Reyranella sp. CPCC 100927]TWT08707.1 type VI secretion system baseplate subunit TssF [Reyranella sp. CPCC 100927]
MDDLFPLYNRELEFLRRDAQRFAEAYPKVAGRLRLGPDVSADPHVERLIEAVALLNARVRLKIEDEFPELTESVLGALFPHYLLPVPPMGIARMEPTAEATEPVRLPRHEELETDPVDGERCRVRTTQNLTVWPIEVVSTALQGRPFRAPVNPRATGALGVLHVRLRCMGAGATFDQLQPDPLRFFVAAPMARALPLYELIMNRLVSIAVSEGPDDIRPVFLTPRAVTAVGFGRDEGMLPYPARSFVGYRLLTEYFALPQKFLFFEISGVAARCLAGAGRELDLFFYLNDTDKELERGIVAGDLQLNCVPVINLFQHRAEPVRLDGTQFENRVIPDARRPEALEIHSIERVTATASESGEIAVEPFFGIRHDAAPGSRFWQASRRASAITRDRGTELFLSIFNREANAGAPANWVLSVDTLCFNRDLLARLSGSGGQIRLDLVTPVSAIRRIGMITPFTPTRRPPLSSGRLWRLLSHLSLSHLSITDGAAGADALREILRLYDWGDREESRGLIGGITSIESRRALARVPTGVSTAIAHGLDLDLVLAPESYSPGTAYLLASVLERFFGLYAAINAFTRLSVRLTGRTGKLATWPPRTGEKTLL